VSKEEEKRKVKGKTKLCIEGKEEKKGYIIVIFI
jgi:hypothetical protein